MRGCIPDYSGIHPLIRVVKSTDIGMRVNTQVVAYWIFRGGLSLMFRRVLNGKLGPKLPDREGEHSLLPPVRAGDDTLWKDQYGTSALPLWRVRDEPRSGDRYLRERLRPVLVGSFLSPALARPAWCWTDVSSAYRTVLAAVAHP